MSDDKTQLTSKEGEKGEGSILRSLLEESSPASSIDNSDNRQDTERLERREHIQDLIGFAMNEAGISNVIAYSSSTNRQHVGASNQPENERDETNIRSTQEAASYSSLLAANMGQGSEELLRQLDDNEDFNLADMMRSSNSMEVVQTLQQFESTADEHAESSFAPTDQFSTQLNGSNEYALTNSTPAEFNNQHPAHPIHIAPPYNNDMTSFANLYPNGNDNVLSPHINQNRIFFTGQFPIPPPPADVFRPPEAEDFVTLAETSNVAELAEGTMTGQGIVYPKVRRTRSIYEDDEKEMNSVRKIRKSVTRRTARAAVEGGMRRGIPRWRRGSGQIRQHISTQHNMNQSQSYSSYPQEAAQQSLMQGNEQVQVNYLLPIMYQRLETTQFGPRTHSFLFRNVNQAEVLNAYVAELHLVYEENRFEAAVAYVRRNMEMESDEQAISWISWMEYLSGNSEAPGPDMD